MLIQTLCIELDRRDPTALSLEGDEDDDSLDLEDADGNLFSSNP